MRIATSELRSFLDKMDAVDLLQQVIAGLVVDVHMQVRFSRGADGTTQPKITKQSSEISVREDEEGATPTARPERTPKNQTPDEDR